MKLNYQNKKVSYFEQGKGNTIVLLHGFLENKTMWNAFAEELTSAFHVVTIDLPGHGESDNIGAVHGMGLMSDIINTLLNALEVKEAIVAGHSMGGYAALAYASVFSHQTRGLVLFHSHASEDTPEAKRNRDRTAELVQESRQQFISRFIPDLFAEENRERLSEEIEKLKEQAQSLSKEAIISALKGMRNRKEMHTFLKNTTLPVLFIAGKQDVRIPVQDLLQQVALPAHSELLLLEHSAHMGWIEQQEITLPALKHFAKRIYNLK